MLYTFYYCIPCTFLRKKFKSEDYLDNHITLTTLSLFSLLKFILLTFYLISLSMYHCYTKTEKKKKTYYVCYHT